MAKALLDTNVWRQLVDSDAVQDLRTQARTEGLTIVVAPAVVYELLRTPGHGLRKRLLKAVTLGAWERLMTEVFEECQDVFNLCARRRPDWLLAEPDLAAYHEQRADWIGGRGRGFWHRARLEPAAEAETLASLEGDLLSNARQEARDRRKSMRNFHFDSMPVEGWMGEPTSKMPGWRGDPVDMWRLMTADYWWSALVVRSLDPYMDWLGPRVDLRAISRDRARWNELWLYEASETEVPREWLRCAFMWLQSVRKVTAGTPGDNQIALYGYKADFLITGDRAFAEILNKVAPHAPVKLAEGRWLPPGSTPVSDLLALTKN